MSTLSDKLYLFNKILLDKYGYPIFEYHPDPTGSIVLGILSANTNDKNRDRAYARLLDEYPLPSRWQDVYEEDEDKLAKIIRPAGMSQTRAKRIKLAFDWMLENFGRIDGGEFLRMPPEEAYTKLQSIKGIGSKTAAVFLIFNKSEFDTIYFPVDTHIRRIVNRLGLFDKEYSPAILQRKISEVVASDIILPLHMNIIYLGREICKAQKPVCGICPLQNECNKIIK
jgi:endonuclease-3